MAHIDYGSKRFLIIDHIKQSRDTLKIFAYSLGAQAVDTSHHAPDIITLCETNTYDVVLLGYDLGDDRRNGQQILEELRAKQYINRRCIVIMITAEVSQAMVLAALEHKPDEYLTKPYTLRDLGTRLSRCFEKKAAMANIYQALDEQDANRVLFLCDQMIKQNSLYKSECLGIKSRQHFELKEYEQAKKIYQAYLGSPNCQWAAIGLGKVALVEQDYDAASHYFQAIIDDNPFYLSAYDWLAKTYELTNHPDKAEEILEQALLVSPLSVKRLKHYAQLCLDNNKFDKATKALSKTNDLAYHSVHKKPDNAIRFAEALIENSDNLSLSQVRRLNNKAFAVLADMVREFNNNELKVVAQYLIARLHDKAKEHGMVKSVLKEADKLLKRYKSQLSSDSTFTIARALIALNRRPQATELLNELAQANPDNMEILSEVVALSERPISEKDKIAAQSALEVGIKLYKANHYTLAIDKLNQALYHFPNHIGVKLNLLQALLVSYECDPQRSVDFNQAKVLIKQFKNISPRSESYKRFVKLRSKFEELATFHS